MGKRLLSSLLCLALLLPGSEALAAALYARPAGQAFKLTAIPQLGLNAGFTPSLPRSFNAGYTLKVAPSFHLSAAAVQTPVLAVGETASAQPFAQLHAGALALSAAPTLARVSGFYDGGRVRSDATTLASGSVARALLSESGGKSLPKKDEPTKPRSSLKRSLNVGYLAAGAGLLASTVIQWIAEKSGHVFDSTYTDPFSTVHGALGASLMVFYVTVLGPIFEEIVFRAGAMKGLSKLTSRIPKIGTFWLPALVSSAVFVAVHLETDPVLVADRMVGALLLSWVFHKEGLAASMAMHAVNNTVATIAALLIPALLTTAVGGMAAWALVPTGLFLAYRAARSLLRERPARRSGQVVPFEIPRVWVWILLLAGFLFPFLFSLG